MKLDISCILITDKTRAIFDGPDVWRNGWVYFGYECHQHLWCHQQLEGVMWVGIIVYSQGASRGLKWQQPSIAISPEEDLGTLAKWHTAATSKKSSIQAWQISFKLCQGHTSIPRLLRHKGERLMAWPPSLRISIYKMFGPSLYKIFYANWCRFKSKDFIGDQ